MFRSRRSSTISPLQPPASTDSWPRSMQSTPGQGQQQIPPPHAKGQAQGFQPAYAGDNIGRGKGAGAEGVKEKRRSGFGWLGGKKKDKDKEKERAKGERENIGVSMRDPSWICGVICEAAGGGRSERWVPCLGLGSRGNCFC